MILIKHDTFPWIYLRLLCTRGFSPQHLTLVAIHNAAVLQVLVSGPGQQWRDYFVCRGTSALTCLLQQLTAPDASSAATFAASRALAGLAASSANQGDIIKVSHLPITLAVYRNI